MVVVVGGAGGCQSKICGTLRSLGKGKSQEGGGKGGKGRVELHISASTQGV